VLKLFDRKITLNCLAFSPDGLLLAAGGYRGVVQLWELAAGKLRARLVGLDTSVNAVAFTAEDSLLAAASAFFVWPLAGSGRIEGRRWLEDARHVSAAALSPDRRTVAAGYTSRTGVLYRFDAIRFPDGERLWAGSCADHTDLPSAIAFAADGATTYFDFYGGSVRAFDATGGRREVARCSSHPKALAASPDGLRLACVAGGEFLLYDLDGGEVARHKVGRTHFLSVAFHPSGGFLATVNGDGKVDYWDARTGEHRRAFDWGVGKLHDVTFDAAGDRAACCSKTGHVVVWDVDD
jgi:WD40 repeat protein